MKQAAPLPVEDEEGKTQGDRRTAHSRALTLAQSLEQAAAELAGRGNRNARRDSQLLLLHTLGVDRTYLLTHPEDPLSEEQLTRYRQLVARRKRSEPIQYITGEREFYGLRFAVTPEVLIPRPETEHLVEAALERIPAGAAFRIVDVGTGSGAIAVAIAHARPNAQVTAVDIAATALEVAQRNAKAHGVGWQIRFIESDLLEAVVDKQFDMVVSNPPYIADGERDSLAEEVGDFEPAAALFAGPTGLEIYQRLIPQAARVLRAGGWLLMEIGAGQHSQLRLLLERWCEVGFIPDLQGIPRVAIARAPSPAPPSV